MGTRSKVDAESKAQGLPIQSSTYKILIEASEISRFRLKLDEWPAKVLIEAKLEQVDKGSFKPELLSDIVVQSVEDATDRSRARHGGDESQVSTHGGLRGSVSLCSITHESFPSVWQMQVDYILGKKVWELRASDEDGVEAVGPPRKSILKSEFQMRKHALETGQLRRLFVCWRFDSSSC